MKITKCILIFQYATHLSRSNADVFNSSSDKTFLFLNEFQLDKISGAIVSLKCEIIVVSQTVSL